MFEFITSKVVMAIAALILIGTIIGFYQIMTKNYEANEFKLMTENIVDKVDGVSSQKINYTLNMTFRDDVPGYKLKKTFRGKGYEMNFTIERVTLSQKGDSTNPDLRWSKRFITKIHLWKPTDVESIKNSNQITQEEIDKKDGEVKSIFIKSGEDFVIDGKMIYVSGRLTHLVFVYKK